MTSDDARAFTGKLPYNDWTIEETELLKAAFRANRTWETICDFFSHRFDSRQIADKAVRLGLAQ